MKTDLTGDELLAEITFPTPANIKRVIREQKFAPVSLLPVATILSIDADAADFVFKSPEIKGRKEIQPIIIGKWQGRSNSVIDGWHRLAAAYNRGNKYIPAYLAIA